MNDAHLTPDGLLGDIPMPAHWKLAMSASINYTLLQRHFSSIW